jgi:hypothetical protein
MHKENPLQCLPINWNIRNMKWQKTTTYWKISFTFLVSIPKKKINRKTTIITTIEAGSVLVNLSPNSTIPIIKATKPA